MPYSITTQDGITVNNIPDDVPHDDPSLKAKVAAARASGGTPKAKDVPSATDHFDPTEGMSTIEKAGAGAISGGLDAWRGVKGFAARHLGMGDPNAVAADTAQMQALEKPLTDTTAGGVGHFVGENLPYMIPGGSVIKATQGLKLLPRLVAGAAGNAALGGAQSAMAPSVDPNVNDTDRATSGALWGAGGSLGGELVGKVLGGIAKKASPYAQQAIDTLKASPVGEKMNLLATNLTDSPMVKAATDALSKVPILGNGINAARETNLGAITEAATAPTGTTMSKLLPQDVSRMWNTLETKGTQFRKANDVPVGHIPKELEHAVDNIRQYAQATNQQGDLAKLTRPATALGDTVVPPVPQTIQARVAAKQAGMPAPAALPAMPATIPKVLSAGELMDLRRAASEMAYKETDPVLAAQYRAYRDHLDNAFKAANPDPAFARAAQRGAPPPPEHEFDTWRKQWGAAEDVRKAADMGLTPQGHLLPQNIEKTLSDRVQGGALGTPYENLIVAAKNRMVPPPAGENRALATALMLGTAGGGAYATDKLTDSPTAAGAAALSPALAAGLLGTGVGGRFMTGNIKGQAAAALMARLLAQQAATAQH